MGWEEFNDPYLKKLWNHPLLTAGEERVLLRRARHGGTETQRKRALEKLIKCNQRLVLIIAKKYLGYGLPLSDLIQEGNLGFKKALEKFDLRRDFRISTYTSQWIRQAISRAVKEKGSLIRIPVHQAERRQMIERASRRIRQTKGTQGISTPELSAETGLSENQIRNVRALPNVISLDEPVSQSPNDGEADTLGAFLPDPKQDVETLALGEMTAEERTETLEKAFRAARLTPREREVLDLKFGLTEGKGKTYQEIAEQLGVTRQRVEQIRADAIRKMRNPTVERILR